MQSAEHIATAVDYDKVFGGRRTKGYEVMRGETTQFVERALKLRDIHLLHQRLLMNNRPFIDESFDAVPKEFTSYTKEDYENVLNLYLRIFVNKIVKNELYKTLDSYLWGK